MAQTGGMGPQISVLLAVARTLIILVLFSQPCKIIGNEASVAGGILEKYSDLKFLSRASAEEYLVEEKRGSLVGAYLRQGPPIEWKGEIYRARFIHHQVKRNLPSSREEAVALASLMDGQDPVSFCVALALENYLGDRGIINPVWIWEVGIKRKKYLDNLKWRVRHSNRS